MLCLALLLFPGERASVREVSEVGALPDHLLHMRVWFLSSKVLHKPGHAVNRETVLQGYSVVFTEGN